MNRLFEGRKKKKQNQVRGERERAVKSRCLWVLVEGLKGSGIWVLQGKEGQGQGSESQPGERVSGLRKGAEAPMGEEKK